MISHLIYTSKSEYIGNIRRVCWKWMFWDGTDLYLLEWSFMSRLFLLTGRGGEALWSDSDSDGAGGAIINRNLIMTGVFWISISTWLPAATDALTLCRHTIRITALLYIKQNNNVMSSEDERSRQDWPLREAWVLAGGRVKVERTGDESRDLAGGSSALVLDKEKKKKREFFSAFIFVTSINLRLSVLVAWWLWCVPACSFLSGGMTRRSVSGDILVKVWNIWWETQNTNTVNTDDFYISFCLHTSNHHAHIIYPIFPPPPSPSSSLTLQFGAAVPAAVVSAVGCAVLNLWDADQELALVPEDGHGQFAPALLHQVFGLQQG